MVIIINIQRISFTTRWAVTYITLKENQGRQGWIDGDGLLALLTTMPILISNISGSIYCSFYQ